MVALPTISVVVPVYNQVAVLPDTLPALAALEGVGEIICVDDGSNDGSRALLDDAAADRSLRVLSHPRNRGRAAARNTGIEASMGEVILFLDADVIPQPDLARQHARRYADPGVMGVLSKDEPDRLDPGDPFHRYLLSHTGPRGIGAGDALPMRYFIAGYSSVRRSALDRVGWFAEEISYGEDLELAFRIVSVWPDGLRYEPSAVVHQRGIGSLEERVAKLQQFGRNLPTLIERHPALATQARLTAVTSAAGGALLHRAASHLARALLPLAPASAQPHLIRLIIAAAVAEGYRSGRT